MTLPIHSVGEFIQSLMGYRELIQLLKRSAVKSKEFAPEFQGLVVMLKK